MIPSPLVRCYFYPTSTTVFTPSSPFPLLPPPPPPPPPPQPHPPPQTPTPSPSPSPPSQP
ncbi:hypothetical protein H0H93_011228 [Arthromyces matolae]|nr:hypothetical protein H0H93_011228 [Arthromyces matolae]